MNVALRGDNTKYVQHASAENIVRLRALLSQPERCYRAVLLAKRHAILEVIDHARLSRTRSAVPRYESTRPAHVPCSCGHESRQANPCDTWRTQLLGRGGQRGRKQSEVFHSNDLEHPLLLRTAERLCHIFVISLVAPIRASSQRQIKEQRKLPIPRRGLPLSNRIIIST